MNISPDTIPTNTPDLMRFILDKAICEVIADRYPSKPFHSANKKNGSISMRPPHNHSKLDLETLTRLMITMDGGSISEELVKARINVTKSAFVQRRHTLDYAHFWSVLREFNALCEQYIEDTATYKGYHVFAVDGTTVNIARNEKAPTYVENASNRKGYNQFHATILFDVLSKTYLDCRLQPQPKQDEIEALKQMFPWNFFPQNSVIVGDRGFESYNLFAHFIEKESMKFLIRIRQERQSMKIIHHLPMEELDEDVEGEITTTQTKEDRKKNRIFIQTHANPNRLYSGNTRAGKWEFGSPYKMRFRVVRFKLSTGAYETLATNLPREIFTIDDLKELYHARWGIETAFRELKYGMGLVNLHGKSDGFVEQEIYAAFIISNLTSRIVNQIVLENRKKARRAYAVDMKMASSLVKKFLRDPNADGDLLMHEIAQYTEPVRPGRSDERKIVPKSFSGFTYRVRA